MNRHFAAGALGALLLAGAGSAVLAQADVKEGKDVKAGRLQSRALSHPGAVRGFAFRPVQFLRHPVRRHGTLKLDPAEARASPSSRFRSTRQHPDAGAEADRELKGAEWLDAAQFPKATFVSNKVTPTAPRRGDHRGRPDPARRHQAGDAARRISSARA